MSSFLMPSENFPINGRIMKNFLCEANKGSKVNNLANGNLTLLAKWRGDFSMNLIPYGVR